MEHGDEAAASLNPLTKNDVFSKIHPRIKLELDNLGSKPEQEIIEALINEIDEHELDVCRQMFFEESRSLVTKDIGEGTTADFELKNRKNPNKNVNYAKDILKLALYISELKSEYPMDILSKSAYTYVNLRNRCKSVSLPITSDATKNEGLGHDKGQTNCEKIQCDDCDVFKSKIVSIDEKYCNEIAMLKNVFTTEIESL